MNAAAKQPETWIKDETPVTESANIDKTLNERGNRYGTFAANAKTTQALSMQMREHPGWGHLNPSQAEALEMIAHKISRILNGDPDYDDSWRDIAGYATLVVKQLNGEQP